MDAILAVGGYLQATDYEKIAVSTVVKTLTAGTLEKTTTAVAHDIGRVRLAFITVETNSIRYTEDGTAPTSGDVGHLVTAGSVITIFGFQNLKNFKCIRDSADATIRVTYFR